jgi:ABC-2 type transport system permease protein
VDSIKLYFKYVRISIHSQLQYRVSFILMMLGNFLVSFIDFIGIWVLLSRFSSLKGWHMAEIALFYGLINIAFAISEGLGRGFDMFYLQVINAEFDRTLLRPRTTVLQVLGHDFQLLRAGRLLQGTAVLVWASLNLGLDWSPAKLGLLVFAVSSGVMVFTGLMVMQAALCFWSTQSLEIVNSFTYGGVEATQWPLPIYNRWFAKVFIFLIPLACVNYFPALAIMGKPDVLNSPLWLQWTSPLAGFLFMIAALWIWQFGVKHYRSTGN